MKKKTDDLFTKENSQMKQLNNSNLIQVGGLLLPYELTDSRCIENNGCLCHKINCNLFPITSEDGKLSGKCHKRLEY